MFNKVFIITGSKGRGKTTLVKAVINRLGNQGITAAGILAPELVEKGERIGYYVHNIVTGEEVVLCRRSDGMPDAPTTNNDQEALTVMGSGARRPFVFIQEAIELGESALHIQQHDNSSKPCIVVVDELGPFELDGKCWATAMDRLTGTWTGPMLWVVRQSLINEMLKRWPARQHMIFSIDKDTAEDVSREIIRHCKHTT